MKKGRHCGSYAEAACLRLQNLPFRPLDALYETGRVSLSAAGARESRILRDQKCRKLQTTSIASWLNCH